MFTAKYRWILASILALAILPACDESDPQEAEQEEVGEEDVSWAEGLSEDQVISAMPIVVTDDTLDAAEEDAVGVKKLALPAVEDDTETKYLTVSWFLPILPWVRDVEWRVFHKDDDGEWSLVDVTIDVEEIEDKYHYWTRCSVPLVGQRIVYFKVQMVDNNENEYENIVSFFVYPNERKLRITLSEETSGDAPSQLSIGYREWYRLFWDIHELALPAVKEVEEDLSSWTTVLFLLEADFSQWWGGEEASVTRKSNTSYCKVAEVDPPDDTVEARLRYSFEDLPITRLASEPEGYFDYNDMVFFVDIMKPE